MKKMFAVILSLLFLVTSSFFVIGCQKAEEQKPAEVKTVAPPPAPAPAPAATTVGTNPAPAVPPAAPSDKPVAK
jgi:hypothetical protein